MPVKTTWTLLLYLTSPATGCQGGETVFYPDEIVIPGKKNVVEEPIIVGLETGMVLLHKHGNDCILVSTKLFFVTLGFGLLTHTIAARGEGSH